MTEKECKGHVKKLLKDDLSVENLVDGLFETNDRNGMSCIIKGIISEMQRDSYPGMPLPKDFLPFFAYGAFKKGELAFRWLEEHLDPSRPPRQACIDGELYVRDGLPLYQRSGNARIQGWILFFKRGCEASAYKEIRKFEPADIYEWDQAEIEGETVNLLVGKNLNHGNPDLLEGSEWSYIQDPAFEFGLKCVGKALEKFGKNEFQSVPDAKDFEWGRFFKLQMAYLLLWSIIERYSSLAYGPRLNDRDRIIDRLGSDPQFAKIFCKRVSRKDKVSRTLNPISENVLDPNEPEESIKYYYQIRCNLSHRGKGAWTEAEKVRQSLREMFLIMSEMLFRPSE